MLDHLGLVVVADVELLAADVALALLLWRIELDVEDVAVRAGAPAAEPAHDLLVGHRDQDRGGEAGAELFELLQERLGLADRAREAVEDEPVLGLVRVDPLGDDRR